MQGFLFFWSCDGDGALFSKYTVSVCCIWPYSQTFPSWNPFSKNIVSRHPEFHVEGKMLKKLDWIDLNPFQAMHLRSAHKALLTFSILFSPLLPHCLSFSVLISREKKFSKENCADSVIVKLQVMMLSVSEPTGAVLPSYVEFYIRSST